MTYLFQMIDLPTGDLAKSGVSAVMKMKAPDGFAICMMHPMGIGKPASELDPDQKSEIPEGKTRILLCMIEQPRIVAGAMGRG